MHLNVPWAQQAEKKSLNVGYQNQTLCIKYIVTLAQIKPKLSFKSSYFW